MKFLTVLHFILTLGLGALAWWQHQESTELNRKVASLQKERDALSRAARMRIESLLDTDLSAVPKGLPPELLEAEAAAKAKKEMKEKGSTPGQTAEAKKVHSNPFSEIIKKEAEFRSRIAARLKLEYGDYFDLLSLSEPKRESFYGILVDQQCAILPLCVILASPDSSPQQRDSALAAIAPLSAATQEKLKATLGESWEKAAGFIATFPEREQVREFSTGLTDAGMKLDGELENKLLDICTRIRASWKFTRDLSNNTLPEAAHYQLTALSLYVNELGNMYRAIRKEAEPILSKEQNEALAKAHERLLQKMEDGMRLLVPPPIVRE